MSSTVNTVRLQYITIGNDIWGSGEEGYILFINEVEVEHVFESPATAFKHVIEHYLDAIVVW